MVHLFGTLTPGNMFTFNTNDGYTEALCRGFRSGILTSADYANLAQCDQLEGMHRHIHSLKAIIPHRMKAITENTSKDYKEIIIKK